MIARKSSLAALRLGGLVPSRLVEPADAAETAAALAAAAAAGERVVAFGGGTLQNSANAPSAYDVALRTTRLDAVQQYDPRDLTIGVGAGMTLGALQRTLAEHGQFLPLDAPWPERATIGGTLAAGWTGPRRTLYGRARDVVIGATVALVDGTLASSGGMVVKNVTGYDMGKLYVGSQGTLGVLVRANFKLLPAPAARRLAVSTFDADVREGLIARTHALAVSPTALLVRDGFYALRDQPRPEDIDFRPQIVALFEGSETTVDRALREYRSALGAAGVAETRIMAGDAARDGFQEVLDEYVAPAGDASFTLLARGLPSDAASRAQRARDTGAALDARTPNAAPWLELITDVLTGDVVVRCHARSRDTDLFAGAAAALREALGSAHLLAHHGMTRTIDAWGPVPSTIATMRALKSRFDPDGVLAPGRFIGGI